MINIIFTILLLFGFSYENLISSDNGSAVRLVSVDVSQKLALTTLLAAKENAKKRWDNVDRNYDSTLEELGKDESKMNLNERIQNRFMATKNLNISIGDFLDDSDVDFKKATDVL